MMPLNTPEGAGKTPAENKPALNNSEHGSLKNVYLITFWGLNSAMSGISILLFGIRLPCMLQTEFVW